MSEMPMPRRTPRDTRRGVAVALWLSLGCVLGCVLGGCHGIPSLPTPRHPCPGCQAAPDEPCGCTPDVISAGYHETRWRAIQPQESFPAGIHFETVPLHPPVRATTRGQGMTRGTSIAPQSHEEPVPAIAASLDDELARYFFDLDDPPRSR